MGEAASASGPDSVARHRARQIPAEGTIAGRVGDDPVLLSSLGGELFAIGGSCTHYGGNLGEGLARGATVRCPLHHACFDLRTGAVLRAPALDPVDRWHVEVEGHRAFVRRRIEEQRAAATGAGADIEKIVIVGGGAAGLACAHELRRLGFEGAVTILSADSTLRATAPIYPRIIWREMRPKSGCGSRGDDWYVDNHIELRLGIEATRIDAERREVQTGSGETFPFDRLLIATAASRTGSPNRASMRRTSLRCEPWPTRARSASMHARAAEQ